MKLELTARRELDTRPPGGDGVSGRSVHYAHPVPVVRRFAPVIQMLTVEDAGIELQLTECARAAYRDGKALQEICTDVYARAHALGYEATIAVQEIYSTSMPSFPGQTVISALLMLDLRPLWSNGDGPRPPLRPAG